MKNMRTMKIIVAMFVMVLVLGCTSITTIAASNTKKMTMYVGETFSYSYIGMGTVKSVKTSKKSVVVAKKVKIGNTIYNQMTAKKKGSAKVTVKGTNGTYVYNITVKAAPKFEVSIEQRPDKYVNINVTNKSKVYFDSIKVILQFRDAAGNIVDTEETTIHYLGAKKSTCKEVYPLYSKGIDLSKTTYKIETNRNPDNKYSDYTRKVKWKTSISNGYLNIKTTITYKKSASVYAGYNIKFYDAAGALCGVRDGYTYMNGYKKKYRSYSTKIYMPSNAVTYKITKRAMMVK